ncbi:MAG TPA: hypothetical protein VKU39_00680 [Streptosporangiaceae bacterium]|nr:hypothetical protein [Streptosporangiaceae bacterium]
MHDRPDRVGDAAVLGAVGWLPGRLRLRGILKVWLRLLRAALASWAGLARTRHATRSTRHHDLLGSDLLD